LKTALSQSSKAWDDLPLEVRQHLYELISPPGKGASPYDPDVNPISTNLQPHIERGLERWLASLREGRHTKHGQVNLAKAQGMRIEGKFAGVDRRRGMSEDVEDADEVTKVEQSTTESTRDGKVTGNEAAGV